MQIYEKYYYIYYISLLLCLSILIIKLKNLSDFFQSIDTNTVYYDYLLQSELKKNGKSYVLHKMLNIFVCFRSQTGPIKQIKCL